MSAVEALVEEDGRYSVEEIVSKIRISQGRDHTILANNLERKKVCARRVSYSLKKQRVDCSRNFSKSSKTDDKILPLCSYV